MTAKEQTGNGQVINEQEKAWLDSAPKGKVREIYSLPDAPWKRIRRERQSNQGRETTSENRL